MLTFFDFPKRHWRHLRTTNVVKSPLASVRLRTNATKRYKKVAACLLQAGGKCRDTRLFASLDSAFHAWLQSIRRWSGNNCQ